MPSKALTCTRSPVALRKESVDRNAIQGVDVYQIAASLSARRAWIEISLVSFGVCLVCVALRKESVDRNHIRNTTSTRPSVALRKESVDRNPTIKAMRGDRKASLSARRAWIEIMARLSHFSTLRVALRKESVDRNTTVLH